MENIIKSLNSLVKFNDGFYKSEKQASFLLKVTKGVVVQDLSLDLGYDYNNKIVGKGANRVITLDSKGVLKVVHNNAKGSNIVFCRNSNINASKEKALINAQEAAKQEAIDKAKVVLENAVNSLKSAYIGISLKDIDQDCPSYEIIKAVYLDSSIGSMIAVLKHHGINSVVKQYKVVLNRLQDVENSFKTEEELKREKRLKGTINN